MNAVASRPRSRRSLDQSEMFVLQWSLTHRQGDAAYLDDAGAWRNHFTSSSSSPHHRTVIRLVERGYMKELPESFGFPNRYAVTVAGARAAKLDWVPPLSGGYACNPPCPRRLKAIMKWSIENMM